MRNQSALSQGESIGRPFLVALQLRGWNLKMCGAAFGLFGGMGAALLGSILTATAWFTNWHGLALHTAGTVMLFLTIPLLILGAHCLDLSEREAAHSKKATPISQMKK